MSRAAQRNPVDRYGVLVGAPVATSELIESFVRDRKDRIEKALDIEIGFRLGCGAFGCTYEVDNQPGMVFKVTGDDDEGKMWQKLWSLQKAGEVLEGLPYISRVVRLRSDHPAAPSETYGIIREGVTPVSDMSYPDWQAVKLDDESYEEAVWRIEAYASAASRYYYALLDDEEFGIAESKQKMLNAAKELRKIHPLARPLSLTLTRLTNLDIPPKDIGRHNLGVRKKTFDRRKPALIFFDPGVTAGGEEVPLELVANAESWAAIVAESDLPSEPIEEIVVEESAMKVNPNKPFFLMVAEPDGEYMLDVEFDSCDRASRAATNLVKAYPEIVQVRIVQEGLEANPPPGPSPRPWRPAPAPPATTRERMEAMVREYEQEEQPFDPEQPPSWRGSARDLVINAQYPAGHFERMYASGAKRAQHDSGRRSTREHLLPIISAAGHDEVPPELEEAYKRSSPTNLDREEYRAWVRGYVDRWIAIARPGRLDSNTGKRCPIGTEVQTLIFSKDDFTQKQAKAWAKKGGFKHGKVDDTEDSYRLRQVDPDEFKRGSFRTITMDDGVKAVIGCPKE